MHMTHANGTNRIQTAFLYQQKVGSTPGHEADNQRLSNPDISQSIVNNSSLTITENLNCNAPLKKEREEECLSAAP